MELILLIASVSLIYLMGVMSPGPDLIMIIKNSLTHSRRTGIWTAVGMGFGILTHIIYCIAGLAVIISQSIVVFNVIKLLGAGYLIYIGFRSLYSKSSHIEIKNEKIKRDISRTEAIKIGFLTNFLNPKVTLYFLGLFTLVLSPELPMSVLLLLSGIMFSITIIWFSAVACFLTIPKMRLIFESIQSTLHKIFGIILIAFGIKIVFSEK